MWGTFLPWLVNLEECQNGVADKEDGKGGWMNPGAQFGDWEQVKNCWIPCSSGRGLIKKKKTNQWILNLQQLVIWRDHCCHLPVLIMKIIQWKAVTPPLKLNFFLIWRESSCLWRLNKDRSEFFPKHGSSEKDKGVILICTPLRPFMLFFFEVACAPLKGAGSQLEVGPHCFLSVVEINLLKYVWFLLNFKVVANSQLQMGSKWS